MAETDRKTSHRSFVSYIDRTREFYAAQGYDQPYQWSTYRDVPFAPLTRPLSECRVTLVTTASPFRNQKAQDGVLRGAKTVWSGATDAPPDKLFTDDLAWDKETTHTDDVESFLPIQQLHAAAARGRIAGATEHFHGVPTDYSQRRTIEQDAPEILKRCREDGADVALLVPL